MANMGVAEPDSNGASEPKKSKARLQDDQVMATNNSSIVSKRSVEKLYYPNEPHFFRYFVKKFQRRSPLINRGYHLRLHVIDRLVKEFLSQNTAKTKVVVNLGCGSDVLPWQCLTRYPEQCKGAKFVDVDFPDLVQRKRDVVLGTPELLKLLANVQEVENSAILLSSEQYVQIGCDLRELNKLRDALAQVVSIPESTFLFVAEVSITYMETSAADALIKWSSELGDAEFCLLEQILPDGPDHPFAKTMLGHFDKLNTHLKSVTTYPTLEMEQQRFTSRGWKSVRAWTLWSAWADDHFFSAADRKQLNEIEPFDEWEEFALFGSHYCLIHSSTSSGKWEHFSQSEVTAEPKLREDAAKFYFFDVSGQKGRRRFGTGILSKDNHGRRYALNAFGLGTNTRLQSLDLYHQCGEQKPSLDIAHSGPAGRMCHTFTPLGSIGALLAGGRGSPSSPMSDCWLLSKGRKRWERTHDLPVPLHRHAVVRLGKSNFALLAGGRSITGSFQDYLLYNAERGWVKCSLPEESSGLHHQPLHVYGAVLCCHEAVSRTTGTVFTGIYAGGLSETGTIVQQIFSWKLDMSDPEKPIISFEDALNSRFDTGLRPAVSRQLCRFGATAVQISQDTVAVVGGVVADQLLPHASEVMLFKTTDQGVVKDVCGILDSEAHNTDGIPRPLLIGSSIVPLGAGSLLVLGGGATCFSMGTFWNNGGYIFSFEQPSSLPAEWKYWKTVDITMTDPSSADPLPSDLTRTPTVAISAIPRVTIADGNAFEDLVASHKPAVIEGLQLGDCLTRWNLDYVADRVGRDREVVVHDAETADMNFAQKNFRYVTKRFGEFADDVKKGGRLYLRALAADQPADKPANLEEDFPTIASDFVLPPELSVVASNLHSQVLRISGPVNMWLHYDVMANIYCQVHGSKRMILFPPSDVKHLSIPPGASSSTIDVFSSLNTPPLSRTHPQEAVLSPGDVLFLPPLWLHTATPTSDASIAVNIFFRDLNAGYSVGRDVYGNRDLAAYEKGRSDVSKMAQSLQKLPPQAREFYGIRLANELRQRVQE